MSEPVPDFGTRVLRVALAHLRAKNERLLGEIEAQDMEIERLGEVLPPIIREYDLWAEDATDGEFRLWDLDRLVTAIVNARAALPAE